MQVNVQVSLPLGVATELDVQLRRLTGIHERELRENPSRAGKLSGRARQLTEQNLVRAALALGMAELSAKSPGEVFEVLASVAVLRGRPRVR